MFTRWCGFPFGVAAYFMFKYYPDSTLSLVLIRVGVKSLKKDLNPNPNPLKFFNPNQIQILSFSKGFKSKSKSFLKKDLKSFRKTFTFKATIVFGLDTGTLHKITYLMKKAQIRVKKH